MKFSRPFKSKAESKFYGLFFGFNNDIFVKSTVQGTELINIELYTKNFHFTDEVPFLLSQGKSQKKNILNVLVSQS